MCMNDVGESFTLTAAVLCLYVLAAGVPAGNAGCQQISHSSTWDASRNFVRHLMSARRLTHRFPRWGYSVSARAAGGWCGGGELGWSSARQHLTARPQGQCNTLKRSSSSSEQLPVTEPQLSSRQWRDKSQGGCTAAHHLIHIRCSCSCYAAVRSLSSDSGLRPSSVLASAPVGEERLAQAVRGVQRQTQQTQIGQTRNSNCSSSYCAHTAPGYWKPQTYALAHSLSEARSQQLCQLLAQPLIRVAVRACARRCALLSLLLLV